MIDFKKKKFEGNYGNDEEYKKLLADYTKTIVRIKLMTNINSI